MSFSATFTQFIRKFSEYGSRINPIDPQDKSYFFKYLNGFDNILILSGAGISTESGIPDYRSEDVGMYAKNYKPIKYAEFVKNPNARQRYWLRNFVGWPRFSTFEPNKAHLDIAKYQTLQYKIMGIVTQNVDGLHTKAGSPNVVELHGTAYWVKCLQCHSYISRHEFQKTLKNLNPYCTVTSDDIRPDGDVEVNPDEIKGFIVPDCEKCGGMLKPAVVFFGENVPEKRVKKVEKLVEECDSLLVMGTSLATLSSYRICLQAFDLCKFVCIVNIGPTRGDKLADLIIHAKCSEVFPPIDFSVPA